jgi:two-component system sensor histidine kinase VicK
VETKNIRVDVRDTGLGIPVADLPHIFDRFYRVRDGKANQMEGNGLGLAIVKSVVEQHGGRVSVESVQDQGSCFHVLLPLMPSAEFAMVESSQAFNTDQRD